MPTKKKLVKPSDDKVDEFGYTEKQLEEAQPIGDNWLDTEDFEAPWMAISPPNEEILFDVDIGSVELIYTDAPLDWEKREGSDGKVKQYRAEMKSIMRGDRVEALDGQHLVPFWACRGFKHAIKLSGKRGGWAAMGYERRTEQRNGKAYNEAFFGIEE